MKKETINIGILGLGTVGQGVLKILQENKEFIEQGIYPYKISLKKIADKNKEIILEDKSYYEILTDSAEEVVTDPNIPILIVFFFIIIYQPFNYIKKSFVLSVKTKDFRGSTLFL